MKRTIIVLLSAGTLGNIALAQTFSIPWHTIDSGGGDSAGGNYSLVGIIGQPETGTMSGGGYSMQGGLAEIIGTVPTPDAPTLTLRLTQQKSLVISWPSLPGFTVQQNVDLNRGSWSASPQPVSNDGATNSIFVDPPTVGNLFFRLIKL